jgi:hypothetical protein
MASSSRGGVSYPQSKVIPWGIVAKMWGLSQMSSYTVGNCHPLQLENNYLLQLQGDKTPQLTPH